MQIIDTHCHIHDPEFAAKYDKSADKMIEEGQAAGVVSFIAVGTSAASSRLAVDFAAQHGAYASLALHPHEVTEISQDQVQADFRQLQALAAERHPQVVAIGECGLDYFYHKQTGVQQAQQALLRQHVDLAQTYGLPLIFHIRDAFDDFFAIIDEYNQKGPAVRGVVHSFTAGTAQLEGCLARGFYLGINGIMTFTKVEEQLRALKAIPKSKMVLETDAPFLTPAPFRGKMCELRHIVVTAQFVSDLRGETLQELASYTTANARELFKL